VSDRHPYSQLSPKISPHSAKLGSVKPLLRAVANVGTVVVVVRESLPSWGSTVERRFKISCGKSRVVGGERDRSRIGQ